MNKFTIKLIEIVLFMAVVTADQAAWNAFKRQHNKHYNNAAEEQARMRIFKDNSKEIAEHNKLFQAGKSSYEKGLNQFSDMSYDEFRSQIGGYGSDNDNDEHNMHQVPNDAKISKFVDWRQRGAVTPVNFQGFCGYCWTFAAKIALEGAYFIKTGILRPLSAPNLLDCAKKDEKKMLWCNLCTSI